jgi:predicted nucleic acid-binding protein
MHGNNVFFDTDILLYLVSADEAKADRAAELLEVGGKISVQFLNEFTSVALRKMRMSWPQIHEVLQTVRAVCTVKPISIETHDLAVSLAERYGFPFYDALIVASALLAGCTRLYSEDMQHQQVIEQQLVIFNPFLEH